MNYHKFMAGVISLALCATAPSVAAPIVHPGDTIAVNVMNYAPAIAIAGDSLKGLDSDSLVVAGDGTISLPVVGTVHVAGKSTSQIALLVKSKLNDYVVNPSVTVRLLQQGQMIFLTGATVGSLPFMPGETLASVLGQLREQLEKDDGSSMTASDKNGGTLLRSALDLRSIVIARDGHEGAVIDGEDLLRSGLPGPVLQPDDSLHFASKPVKVNVHGEVAAPGPIYLYADDTLEQALLEAGGPLASASSADATLIRDGQEQPLALGSAALRQMPHNGDTIVVRAAPRVTVVGQVPNPGEVMLKNGATLLNALYVAGGPTKWANVRDIQVVHKGERKTFDLRGLAHGDLAPNEPLVDGDVVFVPEGHRIDPSVFLQGLGLALGGIYDGSHL